MEPCLCLNQSGGCLPQKSGCTRSAQSSVGVPIKTLSYKQNIPISRCSFWNLTEVVARVKGLWHFEHAVTPLNHLSSTDKASVTMGFIQHCDNIIVCYTYLASCANYAACLMCWMQNTNHHFTYFYTVHTMDAASEQSFSVFVTDITTKVSC